MEWMDRNIYYDFGTQKAGAERLSSVRQCVFFCSVVYQPEHGAQHDFTNEEGAYGLQ